ncbi:MAG: DUF2189 domain-containing protein [Hyphomicrobium aestuarii]|nr:DUF2189 domain-containing protein [Hyphomicrobium aestuarii]
MTVTAGSDTKNSSPVGTPPVGGSISGKVDPVIRTITWGDMVDAVRQGADDFRRAPKLGLLTGGLCAVGGIALVLFLTRLGVPYLAYPMATGFALLAPLLATGHYAVSRDLAATGKAPTLGAIWREIISRSEVRWMAFVTVFILLIWMYQVRILLAVILGSLGFGVSLTAFVDTVLSTSNGWAFLAIGHVVGAVMATILFSVTVVSFPLVLDRDVDMMTAMITSVSAVSQNPVPMFGFAALIVASLVAGMVPFFLGLIIVVPVFGHATWHLYRRVIEPLPVA